MTEKDRLTDLEERMFLLEDVVGYMVTSFTELAEILENHGIFGR